MNPFKKIMDAMVDRGVKTIEKGKAKQVKGLFFEQRLEEARSESKRGLEDAKDLFVVLYLSVSQCYSFTDTGSSYYDVGIAEATKIDMYLKILDMLEGKD